MFYHRNLEFFTDKVYEPAEDSELLLRVIDSLDLEGKTLLDMGCGSGVQGIFAATKGASVTSVDNNPDAVKITKLNTEKNNVEIYVRRSDLFGSVRGKFNFIVFNSPYLPVDDNLPLKETWSGGENLEVIYKFLEQAKTHLERDGKILLLISSATGLEKIESMVTELDYISKIVDKEKVPFEVLYVMELKAK